MSVKKAARFRTVFSNRHVVLPIIHVVDSEQTLRNSQVAWEAGADGIFLINHHMHHEELLRIHDEVVRAFPDWWVGVNCLDLHPSKVFSQISSRVGGVWVDDALVQAEDQQPDAEPIRRAREAAKAQALYFGGVAYKQRAVDDAVAIARRAVWYLDVVVTSGPQKGSTDSVARAKAMKSAIDPLPLAIASGITPESVGDYLPWADCFLVATGISQSFAELDPPRVRMLIERVRAYSGDIAIRRTVPRIASDVLDGATRPWSEHDEHLPHEWSQRQLYQQPIVGWSFREVARKLSIEAGHGMVLQFFGAHSAEEFPITDFLRLFGYPQEACYTLGLGASASPIEDGYLSCLHLSVERSASGGMAPEEAMRAFIRREVARYPDMEGQLRQMYGALPDAKRREKIFSYIDYPCFDSGTSGLGFGMLLHDGIWLFSRAVHYHK